MHDNLPRRSGRRNPVTPGVVKSGLKKEEARVPVVSDNESQISLSSENVDEEDFKKSTRRQTRCSNATLQKAECHTEKETVSRKRLRLQDPNNKKQSEEVVAKRGRNSSSSTTTSNSTPEINITPVKNRRSQKTNSRSTRALQFASPVSRTHQEPNKPRVMFTMVENEDPQKIVVSLGGKVVEDVNQCTHLVTDKFRRTVKALCCIAKGIPLVNTKWLQQCKKSESFIDHIPFLIKDKAAEKQHRFQLQATLEMAFENPLLASWSIHVTPKVLPGPEQMKDIIQCAGGKYLPKMPNRLSARMIIISCASDLNLCSHAAKCGVPIVGAEFILTGLLRHKIDIDPYKLDVA